MSGSPTDDRAVNARLRAALGPEFSAPAPEAAGIDRRSLLQAMGASLGLAGLAGCTSSADDKALPYVERPEGEVEGIARWYATASFLAGYAQPVFGKTFSGRPVKLEGNARHPASEGATDVFAQAALLGLYDPGRSQTPRFMGRPTAWSAWDAASTARAEELDRVGGEGFRLLTGRVTSPTLLRQTSELTARWPLARWHVHEPIDIGSFHEATRLIFGRPLDRHLRLERAEVVVALDDDFLGPGPHQVVNARGWSKRRQEAQRGEGASLLLVAEPAPTLTGIAAAKRLVAGHDRVPLLLQSLASRLGVGSAPGATFAPAEEAWIAQAARQLQDHAGCSLLLLGTHHAPEVQALALLVNERLGNWGRTLAFSNPIAAMPPDGANSLSALVRDVEAGRVSTLVCLDCDPKATAPADLRFGERMEKVELRIHAGTHFDLTAQDCHWHLPLAHPLESWSDGRAVDGSVSITQPLVRPFWSVRSAHTILDNLMRRNASDHELVAATWRPDWGVDFAVNWEAALLAGFVEDSAAPLVVPPVVSRDVALPSNNPNSGLTLLIRPDPTLWDGRFAGNAWLQELPKPVTKLSWNNAVLIAPALAAERGWQNGDEVRVDTGTASASGPVWIVPGQERNTVVVTLGYGREGGLADGAGIDAYRLRRSDALWHLSGVTLERTGNRLTVANTQPEHKQDGFDFVRTVARDDLPTLAALKKTPPSFYPDPHWSSPSWGMSVDLDLCIGCNACVTACQAENNIPVVGRELVAMGRDMLWLRVDHYTEGEGENPEQFFQPVPCMHCEQAPCEMGCPVDAAVHSYDGLNLQVYNRCIGTRTCSSYCPYKVRRFNWFDFTQDDPESIQAMRNPDVTVRQRGVMEKCTYCIQRIAEARITSQKEGREIRDGEVVTACQGACPTSAISFGNVLDKDTAVSRRKAEARDYALLEEVNTRPRTTYLARIIETGAPEAQG